MLGVALSMLATAGTEAAPLAHREVLDNGTVLLVAERPAIPIVVVRLSVRAGAAFDPSDAAGPAHPTADLLTRGTANRAGPELHRPTDFAGGRLQGQAR